MLNRENKISEIDFKTFFDKLPKVMKDKSDEFNDVYKFALSNAKQAYKSSTHYNHRIVVETLQKEMENMSEKLLKKNKEIEEMGKKFAVRENNFNNMIRQLKTQIYQLKKVLR